MKTALRLFGQTAIILFVLWHSYAVAVYATPRVAKDPVSKWVIAELIPDVAPYMLQTSQWQLWNLFAPDPLRRVTFYRVQMLENETWKEVETIDADRYSIWRHAVRFKLMSNMLNEFEENREPLATRFLHLKCSEYDLPQGIPVRLVYEYYVIPKHEKRQSLAWWNAWKPDPQSYPKYDTFCP